MPTIRPTALFALSSFVAACSPAASPTMAPTAAASAAECGTIAARLAAHPDSFHIQPPMLASFPVPPSDHPAGLAGVAVRVWTFVDTAGAVMTDSTRFSPEVTDARFRAEFLANVARYRFRPAMVMRCPIPDSALTTIVFPR